MNKQKISATLAALALMAGAMVGVAGPAMATDSNQPDYWETATGETCTDVGYTSEDTPYTLGAPADGYVFSKVIIKAGSTGNSVTNENTVYTTGLITGGTYAHAEKNSVSHVIVCQVPKPSELPGPDGSVVFNDGSCVANVVTGNSATLTLSNGSTAVYYFNGGAAVSVAAGTYNDLAAGSYEVHIVGQNGEIITETHTFAAVPTSCPGTEILVATASVSITPPTCDAPAQLVLGATSNASFGSDTDASLLGYNVVATASTGAQFAGGGTTLPFVGTLADKLASTHPDCVEPEDKKVWVCKFVASANAPHGYVLKDGKNPIHVSVNALGPDVNFTGTFKDAQPSFVVDSENAKCADTKSEVKEEIVCPVEGKGGIVNITTTTTTYYGTTVVDVKVVKTTRALTAQELAKCDLPTFDQVTPKISSVQPTCTADGSFTLGVEAGFNPADIKWIVDGVTNVASGTYPVTTSRTVTIVAVAVPPHGLDPDWDQPAPIKFTVPNKAVCGDLPTFDLPTLAYTGSGTDGGAGLLFAGGLLVLGAAGVYSRRRWAARS